MSAKAPPARELLVEIGCEELPAGWLPDLVRDFARLVGEGLEQERLLVSPARGLGGPRRLVAHAEAVAERQPDRDETLLGPPARIAGGPGAWTRAATGFAKKQGVSEEELDAALSIEKTPRGDYVAIRRTVAGRPALEVLPGVLESALRGLHFPKAMSWDASISGNAFPFGRPIRWILAVFGGKVVPFSIERRDGPPVEASDTSRGHRFRAEDGVEAGAPFRAHSLAELTDGLERRFVCLDPQERVRRLEEAVAAHETEAGAKRAEGTDVESLANLVEWPGTVLGEYPGSFLDLPEEIRHAVLVHHQKYIPLVGAPAFVAVTNQPDDATGAIRRGSERVVLARLRDAQFFWDEDRKTPLADRRKDLAGVLFHRRLGSFADKADRLERLARRIAPTVDADPEAAAKAAGLAKCDLTTGLVGEFASLQGVAGGLLLREAGESEAVWRAVYDHYRPGGLTGPLPETRVGVAVSIADAADSLAGLTLAGESATGGGDPFGLRRAAFSLIRILTVFEAMPPGDLLDEALGGYDGFGAAEREEARARLDAFFRDRLVSAFASAGCRDEARAVLAGPGGSSSLLDFRKQVEALETVRGHDDLQALAVAATRVRRILPDAPSDGKLPPVRPDRFQASAERTLHEALETGEAKVRAYFAETNYRAGIGALADLRDAVDRFFDEVLVMAEDEALRENRLALLARLDALFATVGDLRELSGSSSAPGDPPG